MEAKGSGSHVGPGEGPTVRMPEAQLLTRKVSSEQTGGAYSLFEVAVRPGGGPAPHIQHEEDECFYVLEGTFEFLLEDAKIGARRGSLLYVPRGTLHAFENTGNTIGKLLVSQTPGGLHERFFEEAGKPATDELPDANSLAALGVEHGIETVPYAP